MLALHQELGMWYQHKLCLGGATSRTNCCCSVAQLCPTLCGPMECGTPGFPVSLSLLKLMSIESVMPSNHLILCCPLLLLLSIFPSIREKP